MKRHVLSVVMCFAAAVISGTIFVAALLHEYALVEVAASVITALQVFFLSSAIGDLLEKKKESNRSRNSAVVLVTVFLVAFYSFTQYFR
jgi:phosphatidylglycerophosphate synthase